MSTQRNWSIRAYRDGDEYGIFELWKLTLSRGEDNPEQWRRWWNWRYKENPAGTGISWVADDGGKIVGHDGLIPVKMKIGDQLVTAFQSGDTMTHPDYRHQGIYKKIATKAYSEAKENGFCIGYGFSNADSYAIAVNKLDWLSVAPRQIWIKPFRWRNTVDLMVKNKYAATFLALGGRLIFNRLVVMTRKPPAIKDVIINQASSFNNRINAFWDKICRQYQIISVRDRDYLNWRYVSAPDVTYSIYLAEKSGEICGYLVSRVKPWDNTSLGVVFDILAESAEVAQCLISRAVSQFIDDRVDAVFCRIVENRILPCALKRSGFFTVPFAKEMPFNVHSVNSGIAEEFLKDPHNWFIQVGDSDWM